MNRHPKRTGWWGYHRIQTIVIHQGKRQAVCGCGYRTEWFESPREATDAWHAHKEAA